MSPLPVEMIDRWGKRPQDGGGDTIYWHVLLRDQPQVRKAAEIARQRLTGLGGLHMTPLECLHMTVLVVGPAGELSAAELQALLVEAASRLSAIPAITVPLGRILYHPEAVALAAPPEPGLGAAFQAVRNATSAVTGKTGTTTSGETWLPHVTLGYSTADQPAAPIIAALGRELPPCEITIEAVSLVRQRGPERSWNWEPIGSAHLGDQSIPG